MERKVLVTNCGVLRCLGFQRSEKKEINWSRKKEERN